MWAHELTLAKDESRRALALEAFELLSRSRLAGAEEIELLDVGMTAALSVRPDLLDDGWRGEDDQDVDGGEQRAGA